MKRNNPPQSVASPKIFLAEISSILDLLFFV